MSTAESNATKDPITSKLAKYGLSENDLISILRNATNESIVIKGVKTEEKMLDDHNNYVMTRILANTLGTEYPINLAISLGSDNKARKAIDPLLRSKVAIIEAARSVGVSSDENSKISQQFTLALENECSKAENAYKNYFEGWLIELGNKIYYKRYIPISIPDKEALEGVSLVTKAALRNLERWVGADRVSYRILDLQIDKKLVEMSKLMAMDLPANLIELSANGIKVSEENELLSFMFFISDALSKIDATQSNIHVLSIINEEAYRNVAEHLKQMERDRRDITGYG